MTVESSIPNLIARFLFALGHELGAAQAAFTGPLSTLIDFRRDLSDDEVDLFLHTIDTQTARLTARLDELTELARLQLGHLTPRCEPLPITALIESALGALDGVSRERVVIDHQSVAIVDVDEGQLRRVLVALLKNRPGALASRIARAPDPHGQRTPFSHAQHSGPGRSSTDVR